MSALPNLFSFSFSSWRQFNRCRRAWWISKVLYWNGWRTSEIPREDPRDRDQVRLAYVLSKMETLFGLSGKIVHELAEEVIRGSNRTPDQILTAFELRFDRAIADARTGGYMRDPKRSTNLFEVYYGHPETAAIAERARASGAQALVRLIDSPTVRRAREGRVLQTEVLDQMKVYGVPVWVKIDLVSELRELVFLGDYKSGKRKVEHRAQMLLYALFWHEARRVPLDRLRVALAYLRDGEEDVFEPAEEDLDELRASILEAAGTILELLTPAADGGPQLNAGPADNFPMTTDPRACLDCHVYHVCKGTRSIPFEVKP